MPRRATAWARRRSSRWSRWWRLSRRGWRPSRCSASRRATTSCCAGSTPGWPAWGLPRQRPSAPADRLLLGRRGWRPDRENPFKPRPERPERSPKDGPCHIDPARAPMSAPTASGRAILDEDQLGRTLRRIAHEIVEKHADLDRLALVGIYTRGALLAERLRDLI